PDFKSARVTRIHAKLPAVPQIAKVASMAVKREAPNKLMEVIPRRTPHYAESAAENVPPRPESDNKTCDRWVLMPSQCAGNSTKRSFLQGPTMGHQPRITVVRRPPGVAGGGYAVRETVMRSR